MRSIFRSLAPFGVVESRRRRIRLHGLGISAGRYSYSELDEALQICRFELWPAELRKAPQNWVLVDVGANMGDYVSAVLKVTSPRQVIAIEPLPSCHSQLASVLAKSANNLLIKAAAGEATAEVAMHFTGDSKMSSILQPIAGIGDAYQPGDYTVQQMISVPIVRIDDVVPLNAEVGILKLDVQGYEMPALRGSVATLTRTKAVQVEVNYRPHYKESSSFEQVHAFLVARGFRLFGVSAPYSCKTGPLWADALYSRTE